MFSVTDLSWNIALQDQSYTIVSAHWVPNNQNILSLGESNLSTCVWSIYSRDV